MVHDGVKPGTYLDPAPGSPWQFSGPTMFRTAELNAEKLTFHGGDPSAWEPTFRTRDA